MYKIIISVIEDTDTSEIEVEDIEITIEGISTKQDIKKLSDIKETIIDAIAAYEEYETNDDYENGFKPWE